MNDQLFQMASATFEAARSLPGLPEAHPAARRHGHGFRARVHAVLPEDWGGVPGGATDALADALAAAVADCDYRDLDTLLPVPTDLALARRVRERLALPGPATIGLRGDPNRGVVLGSDDECLVWFQSRFEAAHRLPRVPDGHPCARMHGHGFGVVLQAGIAAAGRDPDLADRLAGDRLAAVWAPLHAELHLACLNDLPGLDNPTSERLAAWLWARLRPELPALRRVTVHETATAGCHYDGARYRIWKDLGFEGALRLVRAPDGDPRRRLHGHSYRLRLHLTAPLDAVRGWTVDYGDVKALFEPAHARLDHHRLDRLPGLADADPGSLARWIRAAVGAELPALDRIDLDPLPDRGVVLAWGDRAPVLGL